MASLCQFETVDDAVARDDRRWLHDDHGNPAADYLCAIDATGQSHLKT